MREPLINPWLSAALTPLSLIYAAGLWVYLLPYNIGIRKRFKLPCRVISVGNLTFGGTGKSPMVRTICQELKNRGIKRAIVSRGHGGRLCLKGGVVSDGVETFLSADDAGDEPVALSRALPGAQVGIGKNRVRIGRTLIERFSPDVIVLDDGMQYWQLHRDVEITLVDAKLPFGNGRCLPAGILREPVRGLKRSDVVVITGVEVVTDKEINYLRNVISSIAPKAEIFSARRVAVAAIDLETNERLPVESLTGRRAAAVSGIANPVSFETTLRAAGVDICCSIRLPDHCSYDAATQDDVIKTVKDSGAEAIVMTTKDAVKFRPSFTSFALDVEMVVDNLERLMDIIDRSEK